MTLTLRHVQILHLDGRPWASAGFTAPGDAWGWIASIVAQEAGCSEDDVHCEESEEGDLVTVEGVAVYKIGIGLVN